MTVKEFENLKDLEDLDFDDREHKKRAIIFNLAHGQFGFLLRSILTLFTPDKIVPVPNTPDFIAGLVSYRNEIIPVVDLRKKFGHPEIKYSSKNRLIRVQYQDIPLCIFIEKIVELVQYGSDEITNPSKDSNNGVPPEWIMETIKVNGRDAFILDISALLENLYKETHGR